MASHWRQRVGSDLPGSVQYSSSDPIMRIFHMRLTTTYVVPLVAQDSYVTGRGAMHASLGGIVTIANGAGPAFDAGELVTYLDDAIVEGRFEPSSTRFDVDRLTWTRTARGGGARADELAGSDSGSRR